MLVTPFLAEPIYSPFQPVFERDGRIPSELPLGLSRRDFLATEVAGARRHELDLHMVPDRLPDPFRHFQDRDLSRTFEVVSLIRSEEHTSELQSRPHLVCRLLLEKKNKTYDR